LVRVNRHGADAEFMRRAKNANGNLTAIGNEQLADACGRCGSGLRHDRRFLAGRAALANVAILAKAQAGSQAGEPLCEGSKKRRSQMRERTKTRKTKKLEHAAKGTAILLSFFVIAYFRAFVIAFVSHHSYAQNPGVRQSLHHAAWRWRRCPVAAACR